MTSDAGGSAYDAGARANNGPLDAEAAARLARKDQAAAEFAERQRAWADENVAAAQRALDKAHAAVAAAEEALAVAQAQRKELD